MISIDFSNIKSIDTEDKSIDLNKSDVHKEYTYVNVDKIKLTQRQLIKLLMTLLYEVKSIIMV